MKAKLKLEKRSDGWWITGWPQGFEDCGPYDNKAEANETKAGLERTLEHWDDRGFWTVGKSRK